MADDNDRSPTVRRSPSLRRAQTMNIMQGGGMSNSSDLH